MCKLLRIIIKSAGNKLKQKYQLSVVILNNCANICENHWLKIPGLRQQQEKEIHYKKLRNSNLENLKIIQIDKMQSN